MIVEHPAGQYHLDEKIKFQLDGGLARLADDADFFCLVTGKEGVGKSCLASQLAYYMDRTLSLENVFFRGKDFIDGSRKLPKRSALWYDEPAHDLLSGMGSTRQAISVLQRIITMRHKNHAVFVCVTNPYIFHWYVMERVHLWVHVYKRGAYFYIPSRYISAWFYRGERQRKIHFPGGSNAQMALCRFPKFWTIDHAAYDSAKTEKEAAMFAEPEKKAADMRAEEWKARSAQMARLLTETHGYSQGKLAKTLSAAGKKWSKSAIRALLNHGQGTSNLTK